MPKRVPCVFLFNMLIVKVKVEWVAGVVRRRRATIVKAFYVHVG